MNTKPTSTPNPDLEPYQTQSPRKRGTFRRLAGYSLAVLVGGALVLGGLTLSQGTGGKTDVPIDKSITKDFGRSPGIAPDRADAPRIVPVKTDGADKATPKVNSGDGIADLVAKLLPATVSISVVSGTSSGARTPARRGSPFDEYFKDYFDKRGPPKGGRAVGSGFIISPKGYVVTNNHVVDKAAEVTVILYDGTRLKAKVLGTDPRADLALLKVEPKKPLPTVPWGDSDAIRVGDPVVAIGNPFGLSFTVTKGIISARKRHLRNFGGIPGSSFVDFLQTDAAINKGNSGGALFDMKGEVIGINTAIYSRRGANLGIAFAVPANLASPIVEQLRKFGRTKRGWLGVQIQNVDKDLAKALGMEKAKGALVSNVVPDSPAAKAGVLRGDVIVKFDGKDVPDVRTLPQIVAATTVGKSVDVELWRKKTKMTLKVTLGELEKQTNASAKPKPGSKPGAGDKTSAFVMGMRLSAITPKLRQQFDLRVSRGVVVTGLDPNHDAAKKGIQPGDVIMEVDLKPVATADEVSKLAAAAKAANKPGVLLLIQRGDNRRFIVVSFGNR